MKTKRFLSIALSIMILLSLIPNAFALEDIAALQAMIAQQQAEYQQQLETIQTEYAQMQKAAADEAEKAVQQAEKAVGQATCPHNYKTVQNRDVIPATCETDGSHTEVTLCLDCELELESRKVTDTALGHNYVAEVTTPATETEEGVRTYTCSECGDSYTETIPVDDSSSGENKQMRISLKASGEASGDGPIVGPTGGYSLTLNPNYPGATSGGEEINITETTLPQLSRDGYLFLGWSKSSAGEVVYLSGDTITLTENTTLYAIWTINQSLIGDIPASKGGYVYLGGILWRVIGVSGDRYLLISADVLDGTKTWNDAKNYCGTVYGGFTQLEKNAVESTTKTNDAAYDIYAASNLSGAKLFLLSASEAKKYFSSSVNADRQPGGWWLRSPHSNDEYQAGCVDGDGSLFYFYVSNGKRYGSRPAFVLNRSSVLFESAAAGGKSDANGSFSTYTVPTTTVDRKLTLLDSSRSGFSATSGSATVAPGGTLEVTYLGAKTGTGEYVSAMLCDASGNPLYYASLTSAGSGTWNMTIPAELAEGSYTLKVFSEQQNGNNLTDYAGPMQEIALTVSGTPVVTVATPTFSPAAGAYAAAQAVTISCATDGAAIYYTTDGTEPTTGSTVYSGPISVSETTTIKAIAVKDGMNNSEVASAAYTITPPATTYGITTVYCSAYLNIEKINAAESGETITVSADPETFPKGKYFTGAYSSDDVTVSVNEVGDGTFTMPDKAVSVTAVLADREDITVDLTGTASAALPEEMAGMLSETEYYIEGGLDLNGDGTVDVLLDTTNNTAQRGEGAGSLTSNVAVSIENPGLPYRYKSVTFKVISTATYTVTVNNGSGGGEYAAGASVTITANDAPSGQQFKEWTGTDSLTFTSGRATTATATFTMPANAVTVTATYEDIPAATYTVTYKVVNGTWADGTTADKTETVAHGASPASVPTGMIAGSGYTSGIWVPDPSTAVITEAATFVYEFISNGRKLYSITVTPPTKTQYNVGDELDTTGMVVLAYYDTGGQGENVTGAATISNFDSSVPGTVIVTVSYTERETTRTDTFSVTIVEPVSVSYNISVSASPSEGGTVTGGGYYEQNASVTVTATANSGYSFVKWTENGNQVSTSASYTFNATAYRTLVAVFEANPTYTLTVENGTGSGDYAEGASVKITANDPETGKVFKEWTGTDGLTFTSGSATTATATFTMPANAVTVTATYEDIPAATYTVTYKVVNGTWADGTTADKTETVAHGASPASVPTGMIAGSGYTSGIWVPDPSTAVITEAATFVYEFISNGRKLYSITVTPPTKTQYNVGDELDTTGMVVLAYYDTGGQGENVTGAATISNFDSSVPGTVIVTVSYTERETTRTDTFSVTIVEPVSVSYNISVSASPSEGGTVTGGGYYEQNASVTVTATANSGYSFVKWTENGNQVSTSASYTFNATAYRTLVAVFEANPTYTLTVENGTGSGDYAEGASVKITANDPETGKVFKEWTGTDGLTFTSGSATTATATFTMPAQAVTVTATYEKGDDPAVVTPTASVLKGGKTIDLSKNITGAVGSLSFSIKQTLEGCSVTPDGVFTSGSVTGECVVQVTIWESTNYKGRTETITVTVSEEPQEEGRIETENHHSAEVEIKPANLEEVAQAVLTEPEKEELKKGTDITVWLQTDVKSVGEVPAQDAALLTSGAASLGAQPGEWIDISLHKQVGDAPETAIHKTSVPVSFSIEVPERLRNTDSSVTRTFYLLRAHNGEQTVIASTTGTTLQGSSDVFSSYLLAYKDTPKEQFIIIWLNGDGTELDRKTYSEGEAEPKTDKVPTKAEDANYTYSFDKWDAGTKDGNITVYRPLFTATAKEEPEPPVTVPVYYFESGSTPVMWYQGSATGAKFVVHRVPDDPQAFSHFLGIQVDGRVLSPRLYTARSGSVEIMLSSAYQKSLPAGFYTLRADFDDGSAETKFVVLDAGSGGTYYSTSTGSTYTYVPPSNNPRTGDESNIALWGMLAIVSLAGVVLTGRKREKQ